MNAKQCRSVALLIVPRAGLPRLGYGLVLFPSGVPLRVAPLRYQNLTATQFRFCPFTPTLAFGAKPQGSVIAHAFQSFLLPNVSVPNIHLSNLRVNTPTGIFFRRARRGEPSYSIRFVIPPSLGRKIAPNVNFTEGTIGRARVPSIKFPISAPLVGTRFFLGRSLLVPNPFSYLCHFIPLDTRLCRVGKFVSPKKKTRSGGLTG